MNGLQDALRRLILILVFGLFIFGLFRAWKDGVIKMGFDGSRPVMESFRP